MTRLLTLSEVADRLRVSRSTLRALINEDPTFRTVKLKRKRLMSEAALSEYIESKEEILPGLSKR